MHLRNLQRLAAVAKQRPDRGGNGADDVMFLLGMIRVVHINADNVVRCVDGTRMHKQVKSDGLDLLEVVLERDGRDEVWVQAVLDTLRAANLV